MSTTQIVSSPTLPPSWCLATFDESVETVSDEGRRVAQGEYSTEGLLPVIDQGEAYVGGYTNDLSRCYRGPLPVVVFGDHTRRVKYVDIRFAVGAQGVKLLEPRECWFPKFFAYLLPTLDLVNRGYSRHFQFVRRLLFPLPPLPEQRRIVAEIEKQITRLEAGVGALKRVHANLKRYRAAVLKAAVEGRLVTIEAELARREGRSYEPASELLKRILAEREIAHAGAPVSPKAKYKEPLAPDTANSRSLPEGWEWVSLDALLRESLRNGHSAKASNGEGGVPTFTLSAVTEGDFSATNIKLTVAEPQRVEDLWVEPDDILVERSNTPELVGTARRYKAAPKVAIFPDLLIRVRIVRSVMPAYVEFALQSPATRQYFHRKAQGISGSMPKIDQGVVQQTAIALAPLPEQRRIVAEVERRLSVIDELEMQVEANLKRAERLRQAILKRAFEGKLVPQDPNDEPASMLLERIRNAKAAGDTATPGCAGASGAATHDRAGKRSKSKKAQAGVPVP